MYGSRPGVSAEWPRVFAAAAASGVALEIDGDPSRQDLDHTLAAAAAAAGCLIAVDSDAHATDQLAYAETALAASPIREKYLLRNDDNYGLGGSHKVAIAFARKHGFDYLIVLHGDDQGSISDLQPYLAAGTHREVDALLGARFMRGATLQGYSLLRTAAIR